MRKFTQQAKSAAAKPLNNYKLDRKLKESSKVTMDRFNDLDSSINAEALKIGDY